MAKFYNNMGYNVNTKAMITATFQPLNLVWGMQIPISLILLCIESQEEARAGYKRFAVLGDQRNKSKFYKSLQCL